MRNIRVIAKGEGPGHPFRGNQHGSNKAPKLPPELRRGSAGQVQARLRERADIMESAYGVKFSTVQSNPLGVKEGIKAGIPGIGLPRAIYDKDIEPITDPALHSKVMDAYNAWKTPVTGYVTYTTLKFASGLSFQEVMGVVKQMKLNDPYSVKFTVDRLGNNSAVSIGPKRVVVKKQRKMAIIGFDLSKDERFKLYAKSLTAKRGLKLDNPLHLTLFYLGDADSLDRYDIAEKLQFIASQQAPIKGEYNGLGTFVPDSDGDKFAMVLLYDSPQLPFLRTVLSSIIGIEQNHGFTPHTTLAYVPDPMTVQIQSYPYIFEDIALFWGDEIIHFPLLGKVVHKHAILKGEATGHGLWKE